MAENKLADAIVKAHEVLCSLKPDEPSHIFGLIQSGWVLYPYISFSIPSNDSDYKSNWSSILLVRLNVCMLTELGGLLALLKVMEYVKVYGLGSFRENVESALALL